MEIVFAAAAAWVYGLGDFCGGRASRRLDSVSVTFYGQLFGVLLLVVALVAFGDPVAPLVDWGWGALAGVSGLIGLGLLYYCLANGAMTVVGPLTAVVSAVLPVIVGFALGERPSALALVGIVAALVGIVLVTGAVGTPHLPTAPRIIVLTALGGVGFGLLYVFLGQTSEESGMWPLASARIVSIGLAAVVVSGRRRRGDVGRITRFAVLAGVFDMAGNVLFVLASREGLLSLVSVITALYPVSTILFAVRFDHERLSRSQVMGLVGAGLAVALVALGR
ncbi:MAG: DMT family transporter [Actinomycetota bacterium]|nr:DMT family transporter [Actinomycetota bacterium]MDA2970632.1 DMT family transporter [Actinomycetota bacterium]MDA3000340.1 DMT family transporter [Actinomycetota bacterium]